MPELFGTELFEANLSGTEVFETGLNEDGLMGGLRPGLDYGPIVVRSIPIIKFEPIKPIIIKKP